MHYQGVIFDFNGVLWWDTRLQQAAWNRLASEMRGRPLTDEELFTAVLGRSSRHTLDYLEGKALDDRRVDELSRRKEALYRDLCLASGERFQLSPGAESLLNHLAEKGLPCAVATASPKENVDFFTEHLRLDRWFSQWTLVFDDGTLPGKPSPELYLRAAEALGFDPGECIVIEDACAGIEAARRAGMGYIIALGPGETHGELIRCEGVDEVIENLKQVETKRLFRLRLKPDTL